MRGPRTKHPHTFTAIAKKKTLRSSFSSSVCMFSTKLWLERSGFLMTYTGQGSTRGLLSLHYTLRPLRLFLWNFAWSTHQFQAIAQLPVLGIGIFTSCTESWRFWTLLQDSVPSNFKACCNVQVCTVSIMCSTVLFWYISMSLLLKGCYSYSFGF